MNPDTSVPPSEPRRWPRRLLRIGILLVSLVILFYVEENWRGNRAWQQVKSGLEARGEPLTMEQWLPPVPDAENFFAAPVVREKFGNTEPAWFRFKDGGHLGNALNAAFADEKNYNLPACLKWLREHATWPLQAPTNRTGADILAVLAPAEPGLAALREATLRPRAQLLLSQTGNEQFGEAARFFVTTARLYQLRVMAFLEDGRVPEAFEECLLSLRFARQLSGRPVNMMAFLVSCAVRSATLTTLRDNAERVPWNPEQLQSLERELAALQSPIKFEDVLRGERVWALAWLNSLPEGAQAVTKSGNVPAPWGTRFYPSGWRQKWMASMSDGAQQKIDGIAKNGLRAEIGGKVDAGWFPPQPFETIDDQFQVYDKVMKRALAGDADVLIARVILASSRWRLEKGMWPETPGVLKGYFPAGIPDDPVTGQPLHCAPSANGGFIVRSTGFDSTDPKDDIEWQIVPPVPAVPKPPHGTTGG